MRRGRVSRAIVGVSLMVLGLLAVGYAAMLLLAIPRSDTATGSLIWFAAAFAAPGLAALAIGHWLARRRGPGG